MQSNHTPHSKHRLPATSSKLGQNWLHVPLKGALALFSAQLPTDAVSALRKVWVLLRLWKQPSTQARM